MNKIKDVPISFGTSGVLAAGTTSYSAAIDLAQYMNVGNYSAQLIISGSGTVEISMLCSNDGLTFYIPPSPIVAGDETSASDGKIIAFTPPFCRFLKFKAEEVGKVSSATVRMIVCVQ